MNARQRYSRSFNTIPYSTFNDMCDKIDQLERWKTQALEVLEHWDNMWEAIGKPGVLGESKSKGVLEEFESLGEYTERLRMELSRHGWGDFHYDSSLTQDPNIVALLNERGTNGSRLDAPSTGGDRASG